MELQVILYCWKCDRPEWAKETETVSMSLDEVLAWCVSVASVHT